MRLTPSCVETSMNQVLDRIPKPKILRVSEIFGPTIQGEGLIIGEPTVFVRLGGCDYRCSWCDTLYAVLPEYRKDWKQMSADAIRFEVQRLCPTPVLVTISGGNPALQDLSELIDTLHDHHYHALIETQGSMVKDWMTKLDVLCISPKPPSSKQSTDWAVLHDVVRVEGPRKYLKVVVFDDADYAYALAVHVMFPDICFVLQAGTQVAAEDADRDPVHSVLDKLKWLVEKFVSDLDAWGDDVRVLPQLHSLIWGRKRGV
jgi:7-carboxy-7-deazaguanine synthase